MKKISFSAIAIFFYYFAFAISSPSNVSPSNGSINQPVQITLDWSAITGNTGYIYQIDTTPNFNSALLVQGNSATNTSQADVSSLYFGTTYYWRAAAKDATDTSDWSPTWYFTTASSISNTSPSNGATGQGVYITLDWGAITGNTGYIYQIDTTPNFNSALLVQGNSATSTSQIDVSNLYFGATYYWRAAVKNAVDTSDWSPIWHFTTASSISNTSPSNGATGQDVSITLDWSAITGNSGYIYQIDTTPNFNSALIVQGNSATNTSQIDVSNLYFGTTYYWRAAAKDAVDTSDWSPTWHFSTENTVSLTAPSNGATSQDVYIMLDWYPVTGASYYDMEIDTASDFSSPEYQMLTATSSYTYGSNLRFNTKYYWRVRARHTADTTQWSATWNFTTIGNVSLTAPSNGATGQDVYLMLDWYALTGASFYDVELDTSSNFNSAEYQTFTATSSYTYGSNLRFNTTYYWRVRARHTADTTQWSATWHFTTIGNVSLTAPSNGATNQDIYLMLDWYALTGASFYDVELDTSSNFNSAEYQTFTATSSYTYGSNLRFNTTYYWRVRARHAADTTQWSATWHFTTVSSITNVSPSNGAVNISINPTLDWNSLSGNAGYLCEVDTSPTFNSGLYQIVTSSVNTSQTNISGLMYGTTYYWHAAVKNAVDTSDWSPTWHFTTAYELTEAPVLVSPTDNSTDISYTSVGIEWNSSSGAVNYQYQYSTDITFATGVHSQNTSLVTGTIAGLYPHTIYYWRVRGMNANGYSPWSTVWQFMTQSAILSAPVLVSPANNSTGIDYNSLTLDWNSVYGASQYIYEISPDSTFNTGVTTETLSLTEKTLTGLATNTKYFWRIKASDGAVESNWSDVWNFRTILPVGIPNIDQAYFNIYPNPSTGIFNITGENIQQVEISNASGQLILPADDIIRSGIIDLTEYPGGIYFVKILTNDGVVVKSIVKE